MNRWIPADDMLMYNVSPRRRGRGQDDDARLPVAIVYLVFSPPTIGLLLTQIVSFLPSSYSGFPANWMSYQERAVISLHRTITARLHGGE